MGIQFEWQEDFKIGIDSIDKEHQKLFKIINKLFAFREEERNNEWLCQQGVKFLRDHATMHFAHEEAYMHSIGFEGLEQHRQIHKGFRENTLPALEEELERTEYASDSVDHFLGVCAGWLIGHTLTEDMSITGKHGGKWENLLPGEDLKIMKKVITELMFDMFHLESRLISDAYSGEKFGKGVYCRLVYGNKEKKEKQEILMVFEEKLLINTVGKALGVKTGKLDSMLIHASRYAGRQFVGRIMEQFPSMDEYELMEENLLSYEQFQKIFERETLQASLLFNTGGAGYFAFCIIAPHLLEGGIGTPLETENALIEVEQYLMKREAREQQEEENAKPKVLVVDDSKTIRYFMRDLLFEDYEVTLAESGISAIRSITLDRPDLVLLDYEMPVCDGKQTLEMLRSEKSFENLPVFFLTGKGDAESVKKVMHLKPAGYLLKHLKPNDIKKEIDTFFQKKRA